MNTTQNRIHSDLEAQRWIAAQAAREQEREVLIKNTLERAAELVLAGRYAEARRVVEINLGWEKK
jgi:hypothetical protein